MLTSLSNMAHLIAFGIGGQGGGLLTGWLGNLARIGEKDKIRQHEKELLIYAAQSKHDSYVLRNIETSFKDVELAREKGNMFAIGRRFIVFVIFTIFLSFPVLAFLGVPFVTYGIAHHSFLSFNWTTNPVTYIHGMPLPIEFWDILIYATSFYFGKSAYR